MIKEILSSGVVSYSSPEDYSGLVEVFGKCYYDQSGIDASMYPYMKYFDEDVFNGELMN